MMTSEICLYIQLIHVYKLIILIHSFPVHSIFGNNYTGTEREEGADHALTKTDVADGDVVLGTETVARTHGVLTSLLTPSVVYHALVPV